MPPRRRGEASSSRSNAANAAAGRRDSGPVHAEVVADAPVGGKVEEHVKKYLDSEDFARRESQLGEEVAQADKAIDQHFSQVFDHQVSRLASLPGEAAVPPVA